MPFELLVAGSHCINRPFGSQQYPAVTKGPAATFAKFWVPKVKPVFEPVPLSAIVPGPICALAVEFATLSIVLFDVPLAVELPIDIVPAVTMKLAVEFWTVTCEVLTMAFAVPVPTLMAFAGAKVS